MVLTGRLFRCVSITGDQTTQTKIFFNVGEIYREAALDVFGGFLNEPFKLLLYVNCTVDILNTNTGEINKFTPSFYVESYDFVHVNPVPLVCLN